MKEFEVFEYWDHGTRRNPQDSATRRSVEAMTMTGAAQKVLGSRAFPLYFTKRNRTYYDQYMPQHRCWVRLARKK